MKKLILKLRMKILHFSDEFERYTNKIYFKFLVPFKYIKQNKKIDKKYKKDIKEYWKKYIKISTNYHKLYSDCNGIKSVKYIPDYVWYYWIEYYFNKVEYAPAIDDKNYYDSLLIDVKQPETVIKNVDNVFLDNKGAIIEKQDAINLIKKSLLVDKELIIKPAIESCGGSNVQIINNELEIKNILDNYKSNYIIQKLIKQSEELKKLHPQSVNTIRIMSLLYKNQVYILSSVLRIGVNDSRVDNYSSGGVSCGINEDGTLKGVLFDKHGKSYVNLPGYR